MVDLSEAFAGGVQGYFEGQQDKIGMEELGQKRQRRGVMEEREDLTFEQGQEERQHQIGRRGVTESREDEVYGYEDLGRRFKQAQKELPNAWSTFDRTGDAEGIRSWYNELYPDDNDIAEGGIIANEDGSYEVTLSSGEKIPFKDKSAVKEHLDSAVNEYDYEDITDAGGKVTGRRETQVFTGKQKDTTYKTGKEKSGGKKYSPFNIQTHWRDISNEVKTRLGATLDNFGNMGLPEGTKDLYGVVSSLAQEVGNFYKESMPAAQVAEYVNRQGVPALEDAVKAARKEADSKAAVMRSDVEDFGMDREDWVKQRAHEIIKSGVLNAEYRINSDIGKVNRDDAAIAQAFTIGRTASQINAALKQKGYEDDVIAAIIRNAQAIAGEQRGAGVSE